jgi:hypothetical protein
VRKTQVNLHHAKTHLSSLVERKVLFGRLKGEIKIAADFDAPLPPELLAAFDGR